EGETVKLPGTDSKYYIKNDEFIIDTYDKDGGTVFDKSLENQEALASNYQTNITFYENETSDIVGSEPELKEVDRAEIKVNHPFKFDGRSEEHTSELQSRFDLVCRLLLEKKNN